MIEYVSGRNTKAEQLLWLLNDRQTVPLDRISLVVITGTYTPAENEPQEWPFQRGEIIPVLHFFAIWEGGKATRQDYLQEAFRRRRSTEPWDMSNVIYQSEGAEDAVEVSDLVVSGGDGYYERVGGHWRLFADQRAGHGEWASTYEPLRIGDYDRGKR